MASKQLYDIFVAFAKEFEKWQDEKKVSEKHIGSKEPPGELHAGEESIRSRAAGV